MNFLPFLIAKRLYLNQNKKNKVLIISILSKIGISISVFALILSLSALNGFHVLLNKTLLSSVPHGIIQLTDKSLLKWQDIVKKLKFFPGILYCEPYIITNGLLVNKNIVKIVEIKSFKDIKYFENDFLKYINNDFLKKKIILFFRQV
ncbi:MAG: hypothetical protein OW720_01525 [Buchnera aphidicola (Brevicoryne brassicae)]|uniref:Uncharacterized protein n=1 Tax=Buchnera aphidicola (Brevicoryne brassicae) TaxID=911343 RepID=A0AAJ5TXB9_9GAMM|nr:hypothetical protein [Buchnera aphidicola]WAI18680.1 MAG: hypothetical protein OW720_01525 [Buchnera aphidicola (Brevicoryne brassicae)]